MNRFIVRAVLMLIITTVNVLCLLNSHSLPIATESGLPQGSPLSPLLFNFAIKPVYHLSTKYAWNQFFADDLLCSTKSLAAMKEAIKEINKKLQSVGLHLNINKSCILSNQSLKTTDINGIPICKGTKRYLGYHINASGIDWNHMFSLKYNQLNKKIHELRSYGLFRNGLPLNAAETILTSHLLPIMDFGLQNCNVITKVNKKKIDVLIRKIIKSLLGSPLSIPNGLLQNACNHPTIEQRQQYLYNKQCQHYSWLFKLPYPNTKFIKYKGGFKMHPFLKDNPLNHPVSQILTWNFKYIGEPHEICHLCSHKHTFLGARLNCFYYNKPNLFETFGRGCSPGISFPNVTKEGFMQQDQAVDFNKCSLSFVVDASVTTTHLGVGVVLASPLHNIYETWQYKYLNNHIQHYPCSTEMEIYGISECLKILSNLVVPSAQIICDNQAAVIMCNKINQGEDYSKYQFNHIVTQLILEMRNEYALSFVWVKGHNGFRENEIADTLAKTANENIAQIRACTSISRCKSDILFNSTRICLKNVNINALIVEIVQMKGSMKLV